MRPALVAAVVLAVGACTFHAAGMMDTTNDAGTDTGTHSDAHVTPPIDGAVDAPASVPLDCLDAFQHGVTTDGPIEIDPDGSAFTAYCDMTTAGGGWTLVYVYGFTNYADFANSDNAVTPRPTWPANDEGLVPTSTTPPTSPTSPGALDYTRWTALGTSFLVASNIDNAYACDAGTTSIVTPSQNGTVTCSMARAITPTCTTQTPDGINWYSTGPWLQGDAAVEYPIFYFWDGSTTADSWPTHDPCGENGENQLAGIASPGGVIYLRRGS